MTQTDKIVITLTAVQAFDLLCAVEGVRDMDLTDVEQLLLDAVYRDRGNRAGNEG